jgi:gp16 family phage-associated protein
MTKELLTLDEARQGFIYRGESKVAWARRHGVSLKLLHEVLGGRRKGLRGETHKIAVLLGIKDGILLESGDDTRK